MRWPRVAKITRASRPISPVFHALETSCNGQEQPGSHHSKLLVSAKRNHNTQQYFLSARYWGHPSQSPPREISLVSTAVIQVCPRNSGATLHIGDSRPLSTLIRPKLSCLASINERYAPPNPTSGKLVVFRLTTPPIVGHVEGAAAVKHANCSPRSDQ